MVRPGGHGRGGDAPPPPEYMAGMIQHFELNRQFMENMMAQFPRPNMNQQPAQVTLQDFIRLNPTIYRSSTQPLDADDWLRDITYEMESADVAPASYVTFASFFLKGHAAQWWDSHRRTLPAGTIITWPDFQAAFRARFIPQGVMDRKKREFRNLTQGNKTVEAYQREFLDLSRYAEEDIATDARRQEKFRDGLQADIKLALLVHDFADFATLVNKAINVETGLQEYQSSHRRNRDTGSSSGLPRRSARYGFPTACTSRMHLPQGRPMMHLLCLLLQLGSQDFQLHHHKLLFPLPIMVSATSVVSQVIVLGIAIRTRINWPSPQLAVEATSLTTTVPSLMVVFMPTMLISTKLKTSLLL